MAEAIKRSELKAGPALATEVNLERIAEAIRKMGDLAQHMQKAGLARRAVILLLHDATGVGKPAIGAVLDALPKLPDWCLTKKA